MKKETTRTRVGGRKVTVSTEPAAVLSALQDIVKGGAFAKINGVTVDLFSAGVVLGVHKRLNPDNQDKLLRLSVPRMLQVAYKLAS